MTKKKLDFNKLDEAIEGCKTFQQNLQEMKNKESRRRELRIAIKVDKKLKYKFTPVAYEVFKTVVKIRKKTLTQVAAELDMSIQRLSNIINGRCYISQKVLKKILLWEENTCEKPTQS